MARKEKLLKFIGGGNRLCESLFCGNGRVGLIIKGGAKRDEMRLNDFRLFYDSYDLEKNDTEQYDDESKKKGRRYYRQIKNYLAKKKYQEAENFLCKKIEDSKLYTQKILTRGLCDVVFDFYDLGIVQDYYRQIDMDKGEVEVGFSCGEGGIIRRCFVDRESDVVCFNIFGLGDKLVNMQFALQDLKQNSCEQSCCQCKVDNAKKNDKIESFDDEQSDNLTITIDGDKIVYQKRDKDNTFGAVGRLVIDGGEIQATKDSFVIVNASNVYIYIKTFFEDEINNAKTMLNRANYEEMFKNSSKIFSEKINFTTIEFFEKKDSSIEELLVDVKNDQIDGEIVEKLYYYGKYLYLSGFESKFSSGLFYENKKDLAINTHLEFSRLVAFLFDCGLDKDVKLLCQNYCEKMEMYHMIANNLFGCDGIFVPAKQDYFYGNFSENTPCNLLDKNIGSELALIIYNYFRKSGDREFLLNGGYEFIEGIGNFYLSFFEKNKVANCFESPFGVSDNSKCENTGRSIASNCLTDFACAKIVFYLLTQLCIIIGKQQDLKIWEEALDRIPDVEVDNHGVVKEYNSKAYLSSNLSPYISFLFPYNLGFKPFATKKDFETLIVNTIKYKYISALGNFGCGELIDMSLALFTCGEGCDAWEIMFSIIKTFLNPNLTFSEYDNYCMGFGDGIKDDDTIKIDKNTCFCKCIQNMFMLSSKNNIFIFDTFPNISKRGKVTNLQLSKNLFGNMEVLVTKKIAKVRLRSLENTFVNIYLPKTLKRVKGRHLPEVDELENVLRGVELQKGKLLKLKIYY